MTVSNTIPYPLEKLLWVPGQGPDMGIMHGLASSFPKPHIPLGEAWFMSEKRYLFDDLNTHGFTGASPERLSIYFEELISGLAFFPDQPNIGYPAGWAPWFGYLAPRMMISAHFDPSRLAPSVAAGLISLAMGSPHERVASAQTQFAEVLAMWCMRPEYWSGGKYQPLRRREEWKDSWGQTYLNSTFTFSFFLAWRYLQPQAIEEWCYSVLAIKDIAWRAHLIYWLLKMEPIFSANTATYSVLQQCDLEQSWFSWPGYLTVMKPRNGPEVLTLIPTKNIIVLRFALQQAFANGAFSEWVDQFSAHPDWCAQMELAMEQFGEKFLVS